MRKLLPAATVVVVLVAAGAASAMALRTIWLRPGHCTHVRGTRVCARKAAPRTVTVAPSPIGKTFSGNGDTTLPPMTFAHGVEAHWTAQPDAYGYNLFSVSSSADSTNAIAWDNGNGATSGSTYIPPGTYTFTIIASAAWTISF